MLRFTVVVIVVLSFFGHALGQVTELPKPTGKFPVGTTYLAFIDKDRPEIFTSDQNDFREVTAQAWYPAENNENASVADYLNIPDDILPRFGLPPYLKNIKTNSKLDVPVSGKEAKFPVLIFSHGWGEYFSQNTMLMEELASHGYIVFSIAHHYEAKFSFYPDGRFVTLDMSSEEFQARMREQTNPEAMALLNKYQEVTTEEEQEEILRSTCKMLPKVLTESPRIWAADISFIIDELETLNKNSGPFSGKLNLEKLGVLGMSMGGIASGQVCIADKRCRAGLSLDGGLYGDLLDTTISQPFMFISSQRFTGYDELFSKRIDNDAYTVTVKDADHYNLHDFSILHPSHQMINPIDGHRMMKIVNDYTLAFFNQYLKGKGSQLLEGTSSEYPEVIFNKKLK